MDAILKYFLKHGLGGPGYFTRDVCKLYNDYFFTHPNETMSDFITFYGAKLKYLYPKLDVDYNNKLFLKSNQDSGLLINKHHIGLSSYCYLVIFLTNLDDGLTNFIIHKDLITSVIIEEMSSIYTPGQKIDEYELFIELESHRAFHDLLMANLLYLRN